MRRTQAAYATPERARVAIVDDSAVVRACLARWLNECDDIALVGAATNGLEAVSLVQAIKPDIVILDIEMPRMTGLEALPLIRLAAPGAAIIVSSRLTRKSAELGICCLERGAAEILPKPVAGGQPDALSEFRRDMLAKVRALARLGKDATTLPPSRPRPAKIFRRHPRDAADPPRAIMIGASTGGPAACEELIAALKPIIPRTSVVIAQHMPQMFTRVFAEHLAATTGVACREAKDGDALTPGRVFIAPGGHHLTVRGAPDRAKLVVDSLPPLRFSRPSVDRLFESARDVFGATAAAVVLTGMGSDGLEGARALAASGAAIYAQDEASSVVWGMPGAVARAGVALSVLSPAAIGAAIAGQREIP